MIDACADPSRPSGWIDDQIRTAYLRLHELGWVHSVETWRDGRLVGGLYGVARRRPVRGESMFHHETDASKAALVGLVEILDDGRTGWSTPSGRRRTWRRSASTELPRAEYLGLLPGLLQVPLPRWPQPGADGRVTSSM